MEADISTNIVGIFLMIVCLFLKNKIPFCLLSLKRLSFQGAAAIYH